METEFDAEIEEVTEESEEERQARIDTAVELDELSREFVDKLVEKLLVLVDEISGHPLHPYQTPFARRVIESLVIGDGKTISALFSRQSGKSETVANVVAACMILLPRLAQMFPDLLGKFKEGLWVGAFAPVDEQAENLYGRIVSRLTSDRALEFMSDPEIGEEVIGKGKELKLKHCGSLVRKTTCHPRAKIEGRTYHLILVDECFPAGTPVLTSEGWVPIEEIVNGDRRDWVVATQDAEDTINWAHVSNAYRTPRHNALVRVDHEHGSIYATADHPFVVGDRRVAAQALTPGTELFVVPGAARPSWEVREPEEAHLLNELSSQYAGTDDRGEAAAFSGRPDGWSPEQGSPEPEGLCVHAGEQSDAGRRSEAEDVADTSKDRTSPSGTGWEWSRDDRAAAIAAGRTRSRLGKRTCTSVWSRESEEGAPNELQGGPGERGTEDRRGTRRRIPHAPGEASGGPQEGILAVRSRVVRVEVLEPGSPEFDQFSDGADYVYTLGVDSATHTYVAAGVLVGNCQDAEEKVINKSVAPMGASTNATMVFTGTPTYTKGVFYKTIQLNKRLATQRGSRQNHFEADYRTVGKYNPHYKKFVQGELLRIGADSDEFKLSYRLIWLLDRGMFTTAEKLDTLGDNTMKTQHAWMKSPVVVGIDPARKVDSTIVTVVWVGWDYPDQFGRFEHRILNWLDLSGVDWEEQYFRIVEFLSNYHVFAVGVDQGGVGDTVISRLKVLMPGVEVVGAPSDRGAQSKRWKYLMDLMRDGKIGWPAHASTRNTKNWKRFRQQMEDAELKFEGPNVLVQAPDEVGAHDDYVDSLAIAVSLSEEFAVAEVETSDNFFYSRAA